MRWHCWHNWRSTLEIARDALVAVFALALGIGICFVIDGAAQSAGTNMLMVRCFQIAIMAGSGVMAISVFV